MLGLDMLVTTVGTDTCLCIVGVVLFLDIENEDEIRLPELEVTGDLLSDGGGLVGGSAICWSETGELDISPSSDH
jgi:hypothetical protein